MADAERVALLAHLLRRAAFGAPERELARAAAAGTAATLDALLDYDPSAVERLPPLHPRGKALDLARVADLQLWWLDRMVRTPSPLQELMTLFWHNHFATAVYKVGSPALMQRQNQLFRSNALGSFRTLLQQVTRDPAMLIWLDGRTSHKRAPNENYGRELMERFTLGVGTFTESDVHAAARAFTGFHTDREGHVSFHPNDHDGGIKTLLGRTGPWGAEQAIDIILSQPAHGPFLTGKLWRFFVAGAAPTTKQLAPHVQAYVSSGYQIKPLVRSILSSPEFAAPATRFALVRSPAELVTASLRALAPGRPAAERWLVGAMARMGMELFDPPNVGGWPGGLAGPNWINAGTLMSRFNFAERLAATLPRPALAPTETALLAHEPGAADLVDSWAGRLGVGDLGAASRSALLTYAAGASSPKAADAKARGVAQLLLASPEYQLK